MALYIARAIGTAMKKFVFGAVAILVIVVVILAGVVTAAQAPSYAHQSMYDTDAHNDTNSTKDVSSQASETDARSLIAGGCLFLIIIAIVAVAMHKTREKK